MCETFLKRHLSNKFMYLSVLSWNTISFHLDFILYQFMFKYTYYLSPILPCLLCVQPRCLHVFISLIISLTNSSMNGPFYQ